MKRASRAQELTIQFIAAHQSLQNYNHSFGHCLIWSLHVEMSEGAALRLYSDAIRLQQWKTQLVHEARQTQL